jgi:hypothetical protein
MPLIFILFGDVIIFFCPFFKIWSKLLWWATLEIWKKFLKVIA